MPTLFVAVICAVALSAQTPTALSPAQALQIRTPSGLEFSPDGQRLAFVLREPVKGVTANSHVWVLTVATGALRQWTSSSKTERRPQWSPDGQTLAFISDREERGQSYLMPADGGEAQKLTEAKNAITDFRWAPDSKHIAFLASEPKTEDEEKKDRDKQDARLVDRDEKHARLWTIDVDSRKIQQITKGAWRVQEFSWLPAGDSLIVKATDHPEADQWRDGIYRLSLANGTLTPLATPKGPFGQMKVSPDGRQIAYAGSASDGPAEHDLFVMPVGGGQARDLPAALTGWCISSSGGQMGP